MQQLQDQFELLHYLQKLKPIFQELHESQFLDTASGGNLDKLGLIGGYERLPHETDSNYRIRLYDLVSKTRLSNAEIS